MSDHLAVEIGLALVAATMSALATVAVALYTVTQRRSEVRAERIATLERQLKAERESRRTTTDVHAAVTQALNLVGRG
jgi:hypothetical protein